MRRFIAVSKRTCRTGKTRFHDETSAKRVIVEFNRTSERDKLPVRAYQCPFCADWHITSQAPDD
jgi:hypothetical protein